MEAAAELDSYVDKEKIKEKRDKERQKERARVEKDKAARSCAKTRHAPLHSTCLLGERLKKRGKERWHQTVYFCVKTCSTWSTNGLLLC